MKLALRWFGQPQWDAAHQRNVANQRDAATPNAADPKRTVLTWLEQAAQRFVQRLMADAEPSVWQTTDAQGHCWWNAHDPATNRSLYNASETEMRAWIEQRHNPIAG